MLGRGGFGIVSAWIRVDDHGKIENRIAVKDIYVKDWRRVKTFDIPELTRQPVSIWPLEPGVLDAFQKTNAETPLASVRSADGFVDNPIVNLLIWSAKRAKGYIKMHLEYCSYSSLDRTIRRYEQLNDGISLPEAFIWSVMGSLVDAALLMKQGDLVAPVSGFPGMIHLDIKPANTLLSDTRISQWILYPSMRLADFGLTHVLDPAEHEYGDGAGTPGYKAPEQEAGVCTTVESHTNVCGIGLSILSMMNLERRPAQVDWRRGQQQTCVFNHGQNYSQALVSIVNDCTDAVPEARPTVEQLRARIREHTSRPESLIQARLRDLRPDQLGIVAGSAYDLVRPEDAYKLLSIYPPVCAAAVQAAQADATEVDQ